MSGDGPALERLRDICLALPEAHEQLFGGHTTPTWRVGDKIFAKLGDDQQGSGRFTVWCKAAAGAQQVLIDSAPDRFFRPPYVGSKGWIGIYLDVDVDWDELEALILESYRMIAPKRLAKQLA